MIFFFFFWSGLHLQFTAGWFLRGRCDFAVLQSQPPSLLCEPWWSPEAEKPSAALKGTRFLSLPPGRFCLQTLASVPHNYIFVFFNIVTHGWACGREPSDVFGL